MTISISGTLHSHRSKIDDWAVATVRTTDGDKTIVGAGVGLIEEGETILVSGSEVTHPRFGLQIKVRNIETVGVSELAELPEKQAIKGIESWLVGIPGVGAVTADRIVEKHGANAIREIGEHGVDALAGIDHMWDGKAERIVRAVIKRTVKDKLRIKLGGWGLNSRQILSVWARWNKTAADVVFKDPFALLKISGVGFKTADKIHKALKLPNDSPSRISAGLLHVIGEAASRGHCAVPAKILIAGGALAGWNAGKGVQGLLDLEPGVIESGIAEMVGDSRLHLGRAGIYGRILHTHEAQLSVEVRTRGENPERQSPRDDSNHVSDWRFIDLTTGAKVDDGFLLSSGQSDALFSIGVRPTGVSVITGGPGTGKSTLIKEIVRFYRDREVILCAPTGKAADRMMELDPDSTAMTIHRALEYNPKDGFGRNRYRQLECGLLICDESSMLGVSLARHLFEAIPRTCIVVLVGDENQLPSIDAGQVLRDLIRCGAVKVFRLDYNFRQAQGSQVAAFASVIVNKETRDTAFNMIQNEGDLFKYFPSSLDGMIGTIVEAVTKRFPAQGIPIEDVMVLTAQNRSALGVVPLNEALQAAINPDGQSLGGRRIRVGDRVVQTKNDYGLNVFNGEVGRIVRWEPGVKVATVEIRGRKVEYSNEDLKNLRLAYAMTVHKAQGSEFPGVVLVVVKAHSWLQTRQWFYTATTRASQRLLIVGEAVAVQAAIERSAGNRNGALVARIKDSGFVAPAGGDQVDTIEDEEFRCRECEVVTVGKGAENCSQCGSAELVKI